MILVGNFGIRSSQKTSMGDASEGKGEPEGYRWPRRVGLPCAVPPERSAKSND